MNDKEQLNALKKSLDKLILKIIGANLGKCAQTKAIATAAHSSVNDIVLFQQSHQVPTMTAYPIPFRILDQSLQRLRRTGKIYYKTGFWKLGAPEADETADE